MAPRLALAVAGSLAVVAGCAAAASLPPSALPTPSPSVAVTSSPAAAVPTATVPAAAWRGGTIPPTFGDGIAVPLAITAGPGHVVVVGDREFQDRMTPWGGSPGIWRSADGLTWEIATRSTDLAIGDGINVEGPNPGLHDVAWGPPGYVSVGWVEDRGSVIAGVWHSSDGLAWTREELPAASRASLAALAWNGSAFVIVGTVSGGPTPRAAAWISDDGRTWLRAPDSEAFAIGGYITTPGATTSGGPRDVAADAAGRLTAVGSACSGTTSAEQIALCRPWAASSADGGRTWAAEAVAALAGMVPTTVAAGDVIVASAGGAPVDDGRAELLLRDSDGWRRVRPAAVPRLDRVLAVEGGFLGLSTADNRLTLWSSADGETWAEVPGLPLPAGLGSLHSADLAARAGAVVIAGSAELGTVAGYVAYSIAGAPGAPGEATPAP